MVLLGYCLQFLKFCFLLCSWDDFEVPFGCYLLLLLDTSLFMVTIGSLAVWPRLDRRKACSWSTSSSPGSVHQVQIWGTDSYVLFPYSTYSKDQARDSYFSRSASKSQSAYVWAIRFYLSRFSSKEQQGPFVAFFWVWTLIVRLYSRFAPLSLLFLLVLCSCTSYWALRPLHIS